MYRYFVETLFIATTKNHHQYADHRPNPHPPIHPYAWFITGTLPFCSAVLYFDDFAKRIGTLAQSLSSSLDLAAATIAALRSSRRLVQVLLRTKVEFLFALGTAEVIGLPFMLGSSSGSSAFHIHATDRIFHGCCAIHYDLP